jgi:hypothetical protein
MYLYEAYIENNGAIHDLALKMPFNGSGVPQPVVVVGPNGSGETAALAWL